MKVKVVNLSQEALENNDWRDILHIYIDGKKVFLVGDGEPEDSNLGRDFGDCCKIPDLMKRAFEAGEHSTRFGEFEVEYKELSSEEWDNYV